MPQEGEQSFADLVQDSLSSVQEILRSEIRLAKTEIKEELSKAGKSGAVLGGGAVLGLYAGGLLLLAAVAALWLVVPLWLAFLIMAILVGVPAMAMVAKGRQFMRQVQPAPRKTIASVKENFEWAKHRT